MTETYTPPKVWTWDQENGGRFANVNRPIAGPTHDKDLPIGKHPFQLEASKNAAFEVAVLRVQSRLARDARMVW